jgi:RNA polymerase sigma-70 factor (ECF subfamily)
MFATPHSLLQQLKDNAPEAAWLRFVDLYTPLLYHWARRLGLHSEEARDLVQEVFLVLVRKLPEFDYDRHQSFRGYLHTVAVNKWHEMYRRQVRQPQSNGGCLTELPGPDETEAFAEAEYRQLLTARALELIQRHFQPSTWKAFWECTVAGRTPAEVAQELGLSVNAVYVARSRVLARLRQELDGLLD